MVIGESSMKSTEPAIVVRRPSMGKRVMRWMPESPWVSRRQFSATPMPSEVIMPMPVTAMGLLISLAIDRLHQRHAFALQMSPARDQNLAHAPVELRFDRLGRIERREQRAALQRRHRQHEVLQ